MNVRVAGLADEEALLSLLYALGDDNNSFGDELDEARIRETIEKGTRQKGGCHGVIDGDGELAGSVGLAWDRWFYSRNYMLAQLWLFVRPKYRASSCERDLIEWAKDIRQKAEASVGHPVPLVNTVISQHRFLTKLRLWRRRSGSEMVGAIFIIK